MDGREDGGGGGGVASHLMVYRSFWEFFAGCFRKGRQWEVKAYVRRRIRGIRKPATVVFTEVVGYEFQKDGCRNHTDLKKIFSPHGGPITNSFVGLQKRLGGEWSWIPGRKGRNSFSPHYVPACASLSRMCYKRFTSGIETEKGKHRWSHGTPALKVEAKPYSTMIIVPRYSDAVPQRTVVRFVVVVVAFMTAVVLFLFCHF